ncbi:tetratricopeptide repeat protein [Campylobacter sp. CCUG 57310]|uniref:tetratricopeptide repeat protein n=1 Tax=Campylobacter sp. CCUG 57310 TaxID=2517362 RepID=UPI00156427CF|nr:tetratricopeptide repeat protein [Campylobacter sp. CCUG 57310]QKF91640.1 Sel1 domain-containing protein [Campylobacter sp. CCUG 57310]
MRKIALFLMLCLALFASQDYAKLERKCDKNDAKACLKLALNLEMNEINEERILTLLKKSCALDNAQGCSYAGVVYSLKSTPDHAKASFYMHKACDMNLGDGCWNLGYLYSYGLGVKKDENRAFELYKRSCELRYGVGCEALALAYKDKKDEANYFKYLNLACQNGHVDSCSNIGYMYERGSGAQFNLLEAMKFYDMACKGEDQLACYALGYIYEKGAEGIVAKPKEALRLYERACELGEKHSCDEAKRLKDSRIK